MGADATNLQSQNDSDTQLGGMKSTRTRSRRAKSAARWDDALTKSSKLRMAMAQASRVMGVATLSDLGTADTVLNVRQTPDEALRKQKDAKEAYRMSMRRSVKSKFARDDEDEGSRLAPMFVQDPMSKEMMKIPGFGSTHATEMRRVVNTDKREALEDAYQRKRNGDGWKLQIKPVPQEVYDMTIMPTNTR